MVRQNKVLPYLTEKWYGNCGAVRTVGAFDAPLGVGVPVAVLPYRLVQKN